MRYGIQAFHDPAVICVGKLNAAKNAFLDREDATDMAMAAVAQYVQVASPTGGMSINLPDKGITMEVRIRPMGVVANPALAVVPDPEPAPEPEPRGLAALIRPTVADTARIARTNITDKES